MNSLKFFESSLKTDAKWVLFTHEIEAHESEVLRLILKTQKKEFSFIEVKNDGPSADLEAAFTSLDFFSPAKVFYIHVKSFSKWDTLALKRWDRIKDLSDAQGNWLFVSADNPKSLSDAPLVIANSPENLAPEAWIAYFNQFFDAKLDKKRLDFIVSQVPDTFLDYMHWIQLWKLGGDEWAEHALAWGEKAGARIQTSANPAYDWVDAALAGRKDLFLRLSEELIRQRGEDPLRLWGLLGKSIKISSQLGMGENVTGEAPFMITKLKRVKFRPELLEWWCKCDLAMKSTRTDVMGLFSQIP